MIEVIGIDESKKKYLKLSDTLYISEDEETALVNCYVENTNEREWVLLNKQSKIIGKVNLNFTDNVEEALYIAFDTAIKSIGIDEFKKTSMFMSNKKELIDNS